MDIGEFVQIHVTDGIGTLLLARPPLNALTRQMCRRSPRRPRSWVSGPT